MNRCLLNYSIFMVYCLLSHVSPIVLLPCSAMDSEEQSIMSNTQPQRSLRDALEAFETNDQEKAAVIFTELRKAGAIIPIKYLQHMKRNALQPDETIPEAALKLSQDFLTASLAYIKYQAKKNIKDLKFLVNYSLNNAHALSLVKKIHKTNKNIFSSIKGIKSIDDLCKKNRFADNGPLLCWNCLDPDNILTLATLGTTWSLPEFKEAAQSFQRDYEKTPQLIGHIAIQLAGHYPHQPFWAHLAVENGEKLGCPIVGLSFSSMLVDKTKPDKQNSLNFSCYHLFQSQKNNLQNHKNYKELLENIGSYHLNMKKDFLASRIYFKSLADLGDSFSKYYYALLLFSKGEIQDLPEARNYFKIAADNNDVGNRELNAYSFYASMVHEGQGGPKNLEEARQYTQMGADRGCLRSRYNYAIMLYIGEGGEQNIPEARKHFKLAADKGCPHSQYHYARLLYKGEGGEQNIPEALKYLEMALNQGHVDAMIVFNKLSIEQHSPIITDHENSDNKTFSNNEELSITLPPIEDIDSSFHEEEVLEDKNNTATIEQSSTLISLVGEIQQETENKSQASVNKNEGAYLSSEQGISRDGSNTAVLEKPQTLILSAEVPQEERKTQQEIEQFTKENERRIMALRIKKRTQKALSEQTLTVRKADYEKTCQIPEMKMQLIDVQRKAGVNYQTLELVKTIFGQGTQKINTFNNTEAWKAFSDLGCSVENKSGENSTALAFTLGEKRIMKLKYHNPHGHGDENLYDALKPHLKRYLNSINKTPDTLQLRDS